MAESSPKFLIGASIPRSGHHYLVALLETYFADRLFYCEVYSRKNCCQAVPCTRQGGHSIVYQKSHDRDFALRSDVADALYLVQYRHPVPEALSDRELDLQDGGIGRRSLKFRQTRDYYAWWLAIKAVYYKKFHDKWLAARLPNAAYLDYEMLVGDAASTLKPIIQWASGSVDVERLESVIAGAQSTRAGTSPATASGQTFKPRVIEDSPYFDPDLLGAFESYVLAKCPAFGFQPRLSGSFENHPIHGLILLLEGDKVSEPTPERLEAAERLAPDHPEVLLRLARRELARDVPQAAIAYLERLLARNPHMGIAYRQLVLAYRKLGRPLPASRLPADALLACADAPEALVEIGAVLLTEGMKANGIAALSIAATLAPGHFRANHILAKALAEAGRWQQAQYYAERAAKLQPGMKANSRLLSRLAARAGAQESV